MMVMQRLCEPPSVGEFLFPTVVVSCGLPLSLFCLGLCGDVVSVAQLESHGCEKGI